MGNESLERQRREQHQYRERLAEVDYKQRKLKKLELGLVVAQAAGVVTIIVLLALILWRVW
jgi:hypothetical protein